MDMQKETEITLAWELFEQGVPKTHISKQLGRNRDTILQWIQGIEKHGLLEFLHRYENAKKGERQKRKVTRRLKHLIWDMGYTTRGV
jgi:IS30 family transposase